MNVIEALCVCATYAGHEKASTPLTPDEQAALDTACAVVGIEGGNAMRRHAATMRARRIGEEQRRS